MRLSGTAIAGILTVVAGWHTSLAAAKQSEPMVTAVMTGRLELISDDLWQANIRGSIHGRTAKAVKSCQAEVTLSRYSHEHWIDIGHFVSKAQKVGSRKVADCRFRHNFNFAAERRADGIIKVPQLSVTDAQWILTGSKPNSVFMGPAEFEGMGMRASSTLGRLPPRRALASPAI
jgi:hypothetical protein